MIKVVRILRRHMPLILAFAAIISVIGTYSAVSQGVDPLVETQDTVLAWVLINFVLLLALAGTIAFKLVSLWLAQRRESVGSRLQILIIRRFGLMTIIPTIIIAAFSAMYFHFGVDTWFNDRVGSALNESVAVAESYLSEHKKIISAEALAMANDLNRQASSLLRSQRLFNNVVNTQAALRSLTEAVVFQRNKVLAKSALSFSLAFEWDSISKELLERASKGEVIVLPGSNTDDRVRALVKLDNFFDTYLLVGRLVDSKVLKHMEITKGSASEYERLRNNISELQFTFAVLFGGVALLLLLAAVWFGMVISGDMVSPITRLVKATQRVKGGDLSTRVAEGPQDDELGTLNRAFNRMTGQLEKQRSELIEVNRQIDERRRLIEAVLSGVSAGVVALDSDKKVTLLNRSAATLLDIDAEAFKGENFVEQYSDIIPLVEKAENSEDNSALGEITLTVNDKQSTFHVRIVAEEFSDAIEGYIVTFDDITELQSAQRRAAWSGVARRIAHEIKNPLTPIQLAAERLKRKYKKQITTDTDTFNKYLDTITRHVQDIGKMVEEFANFARMPTPVFALQDLLELIREAAFSQECANPDIEHILTLPKDPITINCDRGHVTQVLINLIKNAHEAIEGNKKQKEKGEVRIAVNKRNKRVRVIIEDNGGGFPENLLDQITEPYITTREKGTGLGLAIVKKIIDDHDGKLLLKNVKQDDGTRNAQVEISFPIAT